MARYIIRVELHGAATDYDKLHAIMATFGAERTILGRDDTPWQLPSATYVTHADAGAAAGIRDVIRPALHAAGSNPDAWVLVAEVADVAWFGEPAK